MSSVPPGIVVVDGVRRAASEAVVSVYDRGFLYGDSVFEVVRTYGGVPFRLDDHITRLHASAAKLAITPTWTEAELHAEILAAVRDAGFAESYVRIVVTRGAGPLGLDPELADTPLRVVLVHPLTLPAGGVYRDGVGVLVVTAPRATDGTSAQGAKASNYLANLLALRDAKKVGAYEPLFVELAGEETWVLEGGTSNVFAVRGNELITPPLGRILGGITRHYLLEAAPAAGLTVRVAPMTLAELLSADEVLISSTVREVVPVVRVVVGDSTHPIGSGSVGPRVRAIHRAFRAHVGAPTSPMPWEDG